MFISAFKPQPVFLSIFLFLFYITRVLHSCQQAWDYDLEVLWGGDRPKLKLPTGHAKQLLTSLLEPTESGLQGLLRHRLHAFAQAYRNIQVCRSLC